MRRVLCFIVPCLLAVSPAFATGSMQCEGRPYVVEIQFSLSSGELTELIVANADSEKNENKRFALQQRFVDYRREVMRARGTRLERPQVPVALRVSHAKGVLSYRGKQHTLRCDWAGLG